MAYSVSCAELVDELNTLMAARYAWEKYWRDCTKFALPHTEAFDIAFNRNWSDASTAMMSYPVATQKTADLYDQTSLWAIERLTAGLISLKTPESAIWHNLGIDDPFGYDASHEEKTWMEKLRNYLFSVRASPHSGFWPAHRAGVRSVCAYGDGFIYIEEQFGVGPTGPWRYEFCPLAECYAGVDAKGVLNRMFRIIRLSAAQAVGRWGEENVSEKVRAMAKDPKRRHLRETFVHAVLPRDDIKRSKAGTRGAPFASFYFELERKHIIAEGGYWEFPYTRHAWSRIGARPYCEGPMALALAEVKSLNELAMNELIASQQFVRPPTASIGDNFTRVNLNPGKNNPGLVSGDGHLLVQPILTQQRPDFAQTILEARRNNVREMLYLNLWQILIQKPDTTATEALLRMQEKGELLGPVGISFNEGLSHQVDREIGILGRKGAFRPEAALAAPESVLDKDISPRFTSPLDRLRRSEELVGAQRMIEGMIQIASAKQDPAIFDRLDEDEYVELLQDGYGAPYRLLKPKDAAQQERQPAKDAQNTAQMLALMEQGGNAARAIGEGGAALATGTSAVQQSGPLSSVVDALGTLGQAA